MRKILQTLAALALAVLAGTAPAQDSYPAKPIRFLVCCTGYTENLARVMATEMSEHLKQAVVVETKPGANGIIAAEYVAKQPPDGYTVFFGTNSTHAANQSLYKKLPYDYQKDFVPVSGLTQGSLLLAIRADLPYKTVAELTEAAKKEPGKLTFGAASSSARGGVELYKMLAGVDIRYIPYKTNPQVVTDMLGGRIDMMFNDAGSLLPHVKSGKLRALAQSGTTRSAAMPDVPTMQEAGVQGYGLTFWHGVWAPAGTPQPIVDKLSAAFQWALAQPKVAAHVSNAMANPMPLNGPQLLRFTNDEERKWRNIAQKASMQED